MEIYKRDRSPYFWYQFTINGQRYRGSTRRTKRTEANRFMMAEYKKLMDIRQHGEKPEITLHDAFQICVDSVKNKALSTHTSYQLSMSKLLGLQPDFKDR